MNATTRHLNELHKRHLDDVDKLKGVQKFIADRWQAEQDARALLGELEAAHQYETLLSRTVAKSEDQLAEEGHRVGWKPPTAERLPIGDSISHETLSTLANGLPLADPLTTIAAADVCSCERPLIIADDGRVLHTDGTLTCRTDLTGTNEAATPEATPGKGTKTLTAEGGRRVARSQS